LRDQKAKLITFEMISINRFAVTQNFFMPEDIVQILKKYGGAFDFTSREWIVGLNKYKEVATDISEFCRAKLIDLDPITQMAFDLLEYRTPFTDETKKNIVNYDYRHDIMYRPMLSLLPPSLYHSLYNFQKVGVQFGVDHFGRIILGDEMGVGKTIQAISIAYLF
jgi:SNF2 family DNA or RNA helicase